MAHDKIQDLSICGLPYARFLGDAIDTAALEEERDHYRYMAVYSYTKIDPKGFILFKVQRTPTIDLRADTEAIFKNFSTLTRRGIRRSADIPDLKFCIPDADTGASYAFYKAVKAEDGAMPDLRREFQNCMFFNAYYEGRIIASMSFIGNGIFLRCKHIVSLRKEMGAERKIAAYAARRLVWEICRYGKERGYRILDLGGINFDDPAKRGIAQFKSSFGGTIEDVYIYRYRTLRFQLMKKILNLFGRNIL